MHTLHSPLFFFPLIFTAALFAHTSHVAGLTLTRLVSDNIPRARVPAYSSKMKDTAGKDAFNSNALCTLRNWETNHVTSAFPPLEFLLLVVFPARVP